ncbi:MAG: hypothetical protein ABFS12_02140 [Bacteroidota bacterium]
MKNRISPSGLAFIVLGVVLILKLFGEITTSYEKIYGNMLLFYGIVSVYVSMGNEKRGSLFLGVVSFMIGVLLYVLNNFDIMSTSRIILPAVFFVLSAAFLFLFLDDFQGKIFLYVSLVLIIAGSISLLFFNSFEWISFSASISRTVFGLWPYLFIIVGIGIITDRLR